MSECKGSECKACGYRYEFTSKVKDNDRFIEIYTDHGFNIGENGGIVRLYACPKCGTVTMNRWWNVK